MSELEIIQALDKIITEAEKLKQAIGKQFNQSELNSQIDIEELIDHDKIIFDIPASLKDVQKNIKNISIEDHQSLMTHNARQDALNKVKEIADEKYRQFLQSKLKKDGSGYE